VTILRLFYGGRDWEGGQGCSMLSSESEKQQLATN
jgi:hypothetical protein